MATKGLTDEAATAAPDHSHEARPGLFGNALNLRHVPGTGSPWRWFFSGVWLVYLIQPVSDLFGHDHGVLWIAGGLAIAIAFCVLYVPTVANSDGRPGLARASLVALAALAALACVVYGQGWTALWIYVSAATGMVLTNGPNGRRQALRGILVVGAFYVFFSWLSHDSAEDFLIVLLPVLLIGLAMIGFRLQMDLMRELAQARETVAKLATNEERLRLARDMHDLTGQSLSVITLKSELAAKRLGKLPASAERGPERAGGGRHPARRRRRADPAVGHVRRRRGGRAGLVPARGGDQRDPPLRREGLPDPPVRPGQGTVPGDQ
jgi:hypothetical protein